MLDAEEEALAEALHADLGKGGMEAYATEIAFVANEAGHALRHMERWLRPRRAALPLVLFPGRARVVRQPLGVVLIIAPWNYPLHLALAPLVGVLAAGNCAVIKPSELAPATSAALARLLPRYLDPEAVAVVEGAVPETTALLEERFDHVFYTGNATVGRIVMAAAARHLTPVTLELGGKSPAVVEEGVDLAVVARRIAWGKFLNAGQTCVAPDYVLAVGTAAHSLEPHLAEAVRSMYGEDPSLSPDYGRIVNERHFDRLVALLAGGRTVIGGGHNWKDRYISPTVLAEISGDHPAMRDEIFGPVLPILQVPDLDGAIDFINAREKPLALYAFTKAGDSRRRLLAETSSGALVFGLPAAHMGAPDLPFGGVGESGMGRYHGAHSVDTFSHHRAVLHKPMVPDTLRFVYPPLTRLKERLFRWLW